MGFNHFYGGGLMIIPAVIGLLVLIGLVILVVWAVKRLSSRPVTSSQPGTTTPREIAQARYAKGEISREEYQQIIKDID